MPRMLEDGNIHPGEIVLREEDAYDRITTKTHRRERPRLKAKRGHARRQLLAAWREKTEKILEEGSEYILLLALTVGK